MIAREWKALCPKKHKEGFLKHLHQTGIKDSACLKGFIDAKIMTREVRDETEITLITFWENLEVIKAFAGEDIEVARLYPEDEQYELKSNSYVVHYTVEEFLRP